MYENFGEFGRVNCVRCDPCKGAGSEVGKLLHPGSTDVSLASRRGEKILKADPVMLKGILGAIDK